MASPSDPILTARHFAGGAVDALSVADAFRDQDCRRVDRALSDALSGLDAARAEVVKARRGLTPRGWREPVGMVMAGTVSAALVLTPLAALVFGRF